MMEANTNPRPTVTITTYSTLKRIERQQQENGQQRASATSSELSTDFFKVNHAIVNQKNRPRANRSRVLIDLSQIRGPTGSVRGHHNVVKRSLEGIKMAYNRRFACSSVASSDVTAPRSSITTFVVPNSWSHADLNSLGRTNKYSLTNSLSQYIDPELYRSEVVERLVEEEQNLCVAYTTTLGVIRRTFEDSKIMKSILNLNLIEYEERDIYLNQEYRYQLKARLESISVPALFVDGQHIGGVKELEIMNENGDLLKVLAKFKMSKAARGVCYCCGNAKFIACQSCNGSRKSTIHHFKFNSIALRCIKCDKNDGLVRCPVCCCESPQPNEVCEQGFGEQEHTESVVKDFDSITGEDIDETPASTLIVDKNNNDSGDLFLKTNIGDEISTC